MALALLAALVARGKAEGPEFSPSTRGLAAAVQDLEGIMSAGPLTTKTMTAKEVTQALLDGALELQLRGELEAAQMLRLLVDNPRLWDKVRKLANDANPSEPTFRSPT